MQWLLENNQEEKAAEMKEREKRYQEAINLYIQGGLPARAAQVVNRYGVTTQPQLLEAIASALLKAGMFEKAGDFFEKLEYNERAIDAYKKGHAYRRAVELSRRAFPGYVVALEEDWGEWLVSQKSVDLAINHFIEANQYIKAIDAAINSRQWAKAVQIVDSQDPQDPITKKFYKLIAAHFEDQRQYSEAEKYFVKAGMKQEAVEMYARNNMWEHAHKVAKNNLSEQEISALYINQAQQYELLGKLKEAERLYLKVQEPDLAIHMYKKARQYDHMIRLVGAYRKELLQKTHQTLATQLEREGNYKQAEYHFVQAKEWKAATNMYKDAGMWEDAIRCAKLHGGVNASKQVVFSWAVYLGGEMGSKLLQKFGLVEQAIEYAIESAHFEHAVELAQTSLKSKLPYAHLKHAMYLEDEGRFKEAEESFVKANKPKEAIDMYIHQHDWINAMRVADTYDPTSITDILVAQARVAFERKDFEHAETFLLRAGKPELLVKIYKEARMWADAQRIAQEYCPNRLSDVNEEYAKWLQHSAEQGNPLEVGRLWAESGDYARAIDTFARLDRNSSNNPQEIMDAWKQAVQLAYSHCKDKLPDTLKIVSGKLMEAGRYQEAASLYEEMEMYEQVVEVYAAGHMWDKAQAIADRLNPEIAERVRTLQTSALKQQGDADMLYTAGNTSDALEMYARNGDWENLMPKARKEGQSIVNKYSHQYVNFLVTNGMYEEAGQVVRQDGMGDQTDPAVMNTYMQFIKGFITLLPVSWDFSAIREHLFQLADRMKVMQDVVPLEELKKQCKIIHQYSLSEICRKNGLPELGAKNILSLVRYCDIIPADKVFYDAGIAAKEQGWNATAFVFLNKFFDITEEDAADSVFDNADFPNSDLPQEFTVPKTPTVPPHKVEEIRQWVLTEAVDDSTHKYGTVACPKCGDEMWEASTACRKCGSSYDACVITGYPVLTGADRVACKSCQRPANREDWNRFIMKMKACPWCGNVQTTNFQPG
eukprot:TRINITY_DN62385_c0_g1_i1.p1 TRINITY_DN62385_c0_g1~~TRINITY_DN62385_c0_g1_i1.p1  ORF type:complete len:993 (-),score=166.06 TRINITY_DN62385_c0_g1_i1:1161-4139(-)